MRTALRARLEAMGCSVIDSPDGLGVLGRCVPGDIDALILDYDMPNGDGQAIARVIRKECRAPIIFVSAYGAEHFRTIVMQLPDVYYLSKPVDPKRLESLLLQVLETSLTMDESFG